MFYISFVIPSFRFINWQKAHNMSTYSNINVVKNMKNHETGIVFLIFIPISGYNIVKL